MSMFVILATAIIAYLVIYLLLRSIRRPTNFPPGPGFIPFVGNMIQLRKEAAANGGQHIAFEKWSQQYNSNILGLKLGNDYVVVALSYPLVREVHIQEVFEGRPDNFFLRLRTMGTRKGITCTDGHLWYEHRNFATRQMRNVGYGRSEMLQHIEKEIDSLLLHIDSLNELPTCPRTFLASSVINVLWTLTAGRRIDRDNERLVKLLDMLHRRSKVFDCCGGMLTQMPFLRFLIPNKIGYNLIQELNKEMYSFFMETIDEHKQQKPADGDGDVDFIYAYLREMDQRRNDDSNNTFNETQLVMNILDFFIAGSQTTSTTMDLSIMMLALRPDIQDELYKEVITNMQANPNEYPHLSSRTLFPQLDAFIMEVQRYYHITPITGPRRALWDTTLGGYSIPKNTTILIGLRSVHMDKQHWGDPEKFRPNRFIDADGKTTKDEYFMPFGQGRRRCLGDALARSCIFSFLIKIIQRFRVVSCESDMPSMILQPGITLTPKPYKVKFVKRQ